MAHLKALVEYINLFNKQVVLKLMGFSLYAAEVAEIGSIYLRVFTLAPQILLQVVIQMILLYSEARAVFEGNLGLYSSTRHFFLSTCRY